MKIWKVSHGTHFITDDQHSRALQDSFVTVHPDTPAKGNSAISQGDNFCDNVQEGDIFYLCRSTQIVSALGIFLGKPPYHSHNLKYKDDGALWCRDVVFFSVEGKSPYEGPEYWWTPNNNSTFTQVPVEQYNDFETYILKNHFKINLITLMDWRNRMLDGLRINVNQIAAHIKQFILTGPPGTGKTYLAKQLAVSLCNDANLAAASEVREAFKRLQKSGKAAIIQFHPSYNYEDLVRGIQVQTTDNQVAYLTVDRVFAKMCEDAAKALGEASGDTDKEKKFVLIIDEINRANLAAVLGELIYALEYRAEAVSTPYATDPELDFRG